MPRKRQVYLLDPRQFDPETIAVAFAKTSRSPQGFRAIAAELTAEKSAQFHEKWVVGYGHASVAEHAVLHIGVENISRLAVETLESNRLASYTEKSTRYQVWNDEEYYFPEELERHKLMEPFKKAIQQSFQIYAKGYQTLIRFLKDRELRQEQENETGWENRIRGKAADACRFLLPACALTNVGMTINSRSLEHLLCKMLSHPLLEVRSVGQELQQIAAASVPTLVKYALAQPYLENMCREMQSFALEKSFDGTKDLDWCNLLAFDPQIEEKILAAALFKYNALSYERARQIVLAMPLADKRRFAERLLGDIRDHEQPIRELEYGTFTFELILDQGAFYELKRHRMMTLTPQPLTADLGFSTPRLMVDAGLRSDYELAMNMARETFQLVSEFNPDIASYVIPNGFLRRTLLTLNLRSAIHLLSLRTSSNAHFSVRRVAQRMGEMIRSKLPLLGDYLSMPQDEDWQTIQNLYFT
jgi:thymidylate synthase ThyX